VFIDTVSTSGSGPTRQFPFPRTVMMCKAAPFPEGYMRFVLSIFKNTHVLMCGANAASDLLEIREIPSESSRTCEHEKKKTRKNPTREDNQARRKYRDSATVCCPIRWLRLSGCEDGGCVKVVDTSYMVHHSVGRFDGCNVGYTLLRTHQINKMGPSPWLN
jgi:hypothetical protein